LYFTAKILQKDTKQKDEIAYASADFSQKTTKGSLVPTNSVPVIESKVQETCALTPYAPRVSTNTDAQSIKPRLESLPKEQQAKEANQSKLLCAMQYQ